MYVALMEQDRMVAQLVSQYLQDGGHKVIELPFDLRNLQEKLYDLVICDFHALNKSGQSIYAELRQEKALALLPCLWIAARVTSQDVQLIRKDPLSSLLIKPFTRVVFDDALRRCLRHCLRLQAILPSQETAVAAESVVVDWRGDMERIQRQHQQIRERLLIEPQKVFDLRVREAEQQGKTIDKQALRLQLLDLILLKTATLIERDAATANLILAQFRLHNVLEVQAFEAGLEALVHLQETATDLIIMEWHPDEISGLGLYNRIREAALHRTTPILLLVSEAELERVQILLGEDLHLGILTKPIQPKKMSEAMLQLMAASLSAQDIDAALSSAFRRASSHALLLDLVRDFKGRLPGMALHLVNFLQTLFSQKLYGEAERMGLALLEDPQMGLAAAGVLAKVYHQSQRTEAAANILRYLTALAPDRLDRLLLAAEEEMLLLRPERAESYVRRAEQIDAEHVRVQAAAFLLDAFNKHPNVVAASGALKNFASLLNSVGVAMAQSGQAQDAERYYRSALCFVNEKMDQARLTYNLGLCYARLGDKDKARDLMIEADRLAEGQLPKAKAYIDKGGYSTRRPA